MALVKCGQLVFRPVQIIVHMRGQSLIRSKFMSSWILKRYLLGSMMNQ